MKPSSEDGLSMDLNHGKRKKKENKYLSDHEGFNFSSMGNMWANAEIDHRTTAVYSGGGAIGNFGFDEVFLVFIVLQQSMRMKSMKNEGLTLNISSSFSLDTTSLSNFCFSLIALSDTFSRAG